MMMLRSSLCLLLFSFFPTSCSPQETNVRTSDVKKETICETLARSCVDGRLYCFLHRLACDEDTSSSAPEGEEEESSTQEQQLLKDPDFEGGELGTMTDENSDWLCKRVGQDTTGFDIERVERGGNRLVYMSIPDHANPQRFERVSLRQEVDLMPQVLYRATVQIKWLNTDNDNQDAIISFWARHTGGQRTFAGKDVWLKDGAWTTLTFDFMATYHEDPIHVYVSLLPHQFPERTDILIDNLELWQMQRFEVNEASSGDDNLLRNSNFDDKDDATAFWDVTKTLDGFSLKIRSKGSDTKQNQVRLYMPPSSSNKDFLQLAQTITVKAGALYLVSLSVRWNNYGENGYKNGICNVMIDQNGAKYGPVDHQLVRGDWHTVEFYHGAVADGDARFYVQVFGWGNFGSAMDVSFADLSIRSVDS